MEFVQKIVADHEDDQKPVRVAIFDTGVDERHPEIKKASERILHKKTKLKQIAAMQGFPDSLNPSRDRHGHGTHCASVLMKTAPNAALYIARVVDDNETLYRENDDENEYVHVCQVLMRINIVS